MKEKDGVNTGYLDYIPFAKTIRKKIEQDVKEVGFQQAAYNIVKFIGKDKLVIKEKNDKTKQTIANEPGIVVVNHPYFAEIIVAVAALEPRDNIYLIGISNFLGIGDEFSKHIIPVYMTNQMKSTKQKFPVKIGNALGFGQKVPCSTAHEENIRSMQDAIDKINCGGLVVMFPEGIQSGQNTKWFNGVGYILLGIEDKNNAYLTFLHVRGVSNWDYLRLLPNIKKHLPQIEAIFSEPVTVLSSLSGIDSPKIITEKLHESYRDWQSRI